METLPGIADTRGKQGFHIHMDVLVISRKLNLPVLNIREDTNKAVVDSRRVLLGDDALSRQHGGVVDAACNILPIQPLVELNGGLEIIGKGIGLFAEPSAP